MISVSITERLPKGCRKRPVIPPVNEKRLGDMPEVPLSVYLTSSTQGTQPAVIKTRPGDSPEQPILLSLDPSDSCALGMGEAAHVDEQPHSPKSAQDESDNERIKSWIQDVNRQLNARSIITESLMQEPTMSPLPPASPTGSMTLRLRYLTRATLEESPVTYPGASKETHCPQDQDEDACTTVLSRRGSPESHVAQAQLCFGQHDLIPWQIDELPESPEDSLSVSSEI